ncbi:uncharacterized protein MEPE_04217 [Melanopsichium pennsylvanicum]|uniref:Effector family protein Eff1 n=2 Tax=Melanopsichium pennsylvanicum TaxID=63383 RepID=A0AAJ4XR09_9BASI|nr:effector family protein Eff1-10 [Melanopsichium pennsylvanicum 4]SNX85508.1 uncharacterized protein MEPE_04217 [Melanopsichium pennsylvanicum]
MMLLAIQVLLGLGLTGHLRVFAAPMNPRFQQLDSHASLHGSSQPTHDNYDWSDRSSPFNQQTRAVRSTLQGWPTQNRLALDRQDWPLTSDHHPDAFAVGDQHSGGEPSTWYGVSQVRIPGTSGDELHWQNAPHPRSSLQQPSTSYGNLPVPILDTSRSYLQQHNMLSSHSSFLQDHDVRPFFDMNAEQAFVDSLLDYPSDQEARSPQSEQHSHTQVSGVDSREELPPKNLYTHDLDDRRMRRSSWNARFRMQWPEPPALAELKFIAPIGASKKPKFQVKVRLSKDTDNFNIINARVFNHHLKVLDLDKVKALKTQLVKLNPLKRISRILPFVKIEPVAPATAVDVLMTEHNIHAHGAIRIEGEKKPIYAFWGIPNKSSGAADDVDFYGAGYLDKEKNKAVDDFLSQQLEQAKYAARAAHR